MGCSPCRVVSAYGIKSSKFDFFVETFRSEGKEEKVHIERQDPITLRELRNSGIANYKNS